MVEMVMFFIVALIIILVIFAILFLGLGQDIDFLMECYYELADEKERQNTGVSSKEKAVSENIEKLINTYRLRKDE